MTCMKCGKETDDKAGYCNECREIGYEEVKRVKECCKGLFDGTFKPLLRQDLVWH